MNPQDPYQALDQLNAVNELKQVIGEAAVYAAVFLTIFLFRNIIEDWAKCLLWKWVTGRDYRQDEVVILDGDYGRISRIGLFRTVFYIYHLDSTQDTIQVQTKRIVFNSELKEHKLEKPLDMHRIPEVVKQLTLQK